MGGPGIDWVSAIGVLAVGLAVGAGFAWRMRRGAPKSEAPGAPLERRDLEGKRDALFRQLAELEDAAAKRSPEQLARERFELELAAARALRDLDRLAPSPAAATPTPGPPEDLGAAPAAAAAQGSQALRGFLWGTGSMVALAALVFFVVEGSRPRPEGGQVTGDLPDRPGQAPPDADEAALRGAVDRDPDDVESRLALARLYLSRQDMMGVWNETKVVLEKSPGEPRALSYQSLVRLAMGQPEIAVEMLKQAITTAPDQVDPWVHLSFVYSQMGRSEEAGRTMAEARRRFPAHAEALARLEAEISSSAAPATPALEGDPHATIAAPGAPAAAPPPEAPPDRPREMAAAVGLGRKVEGVLELDPALGPLPGGVLFLMLREAGFGAGPPLAAKRIASPSFPMRFEIGEADSMTGDPLPAQLLVEARLDSDGDPTTRPPTDPRVREDFVKAGTADLRLVLRRPD